MSCLADPTYDVRITVLKRILRLTKSIRPGDSKNILLQWVGSNLQPVLTEQLFVEEHPKCLYYNLKIIFSWNVECPFNNGEDESTTLPFWDRLVHLNNTMSHAKTREIILCCMGMCMKQFAKLLRNGVLMDGFKTSELSAPLVRINEGNRFSDAMLRANFFVILVKNQSAPSETVDARRAAAEELLRRVFLKKQTLLLPLCPTCTSLQNAMKAISKRNAWKLVCLNLSVITHARYLTYGSYALSCLRTRMPI
uniref:Uncharacterized protein n=1 Tax=Arundo donax TaxID=35708 RepID=A0A0A9F063_ARUDO